MIAALPIHLLRGTKNLTPSELELRFKDDESKLYNHGTWNERCTESGVFIDLSQLRWANLGALVQLALWVENSTKSGIKVFIALPLKRLTKNEFASSNLSYEQKIALRDKRSKANDFLKVTRFVDAVACKHLDIEVSVRITEDFEFTREEEQVDFLSFCDAFNKKVALQSTRKFSNYDYRYIFPMTWIRCDTPILELNALEDDFKRILSNEERGLSQIDVLSLKNVILSELMKNVREHSGNNYALLSIGLINTKSLYRLKANRELFFTNDIEKQYTQWIINQNIESQVELYFGDTGKGLFTENYVHAFEVSKKVKVDLTSKKDKSRLLEWAFDKWSTSKVNEKIRGTKGLYRINRIVNKYNGIFHIRTGDVDGGFQKGGFAVPHWLEFKSGLAKSPGTLVQIKLCSYNEVTRFNFTFEKNRKTRQWKSIIFYLNKYNHIDFDEFIKENIKTDHNILVIVQSKKDVSDDMLQAFLEDKLKLLSHLRHPNGVALYISNELGKGTVENLVNSVHEIILKEIQHSQMQEIEHPDSEIVYDPVLVLEKEQNLFWYGGSDTVVQLLNEVVNPINRGKKLSEIEYYTRLDTNSRTNIRLHFQNDDSIIVLQNDELAIDFTTIPDLFRSKLNKILNEEMPSVLNQICSPRLQPISKWHDIKHILQDNEIGFALALYLKVLDYYKRNGKEFIINKNTFILIDDNQQKVLAIEFSKLLGISINHIISATDDIDVNIPRRTKLFSHTDYVIILTSIIFSSETIRRLVKHVRRDLADPIIILCLANYRSNDIQSLHTWNEYTPIVSLYQHNTKEADRKELTWNLPYYVNKLTTLKALKEFVSPNFQIEETLKFDEIRNSVCLPTELKKHIIATKSFHYNHVGKYNSRHFNFYIDQQKILKEESVIWDQLHEKIRSWKLKNEIETFTLYIQNHNKDNEGIFENCVIFLQQKMRITKVFNVEASDKLIIIESNVVYIDFGSLTGKSINAFIPSITITKNLLMCVAFDQFQSDEIHFYKKLKTLRHSDSELTISSQKQLELFSRDENYGKAITKKKVENETKLEIFFLYKFPLPVYNSVTCPICEQKRALENYNANEEYLIRFSEDRKSRIKIRDRTEVINSFPYPCDFYINEDDKEFELSSILIMKMYELRMYLEKALHNTQFRINILEYLVNILGDLKSQVMDAESDLYALLYLLSNEVNWLQRDPLVYREMRHILSEIAIEVADAKIAVLMNHFDTNKSSNSNSLKLAVRYKFAAIGLLRSANKLKFCEHIARIIYSSVNENKISDNILQNTFYHIISLFKNKYNKSKTYYSVLDREIHKIKRLGLPLTVQQKVYLYKINVLSQRSLKKLDIANIDSDCHIIINLKKEIGEHYNKISHPDPVEHFVSLDFSQLEDFQSDVEAQKEESVYFENFKSIQKRLTRNWEIVWLYIERIIHVHIAKLSDEMLDSKIFKNYYIVNKIFQTFHHDNFIGQNDRFTELIYLISSDLNNLFIFYEEYVNIYKLIYDTVIKVKNTRNENQDSMIIKLISEFPAKISSEITDVFSLNEFPKRQLINLENIEVFYPKSELNKNLRLIKNNIDNKKNIDKKLSDIIITICSEEIVVLSEKYIHVKISYDSTNNYNKTPNKNGSLSDFKGELKKFGGDLNNAQLDEKGFFNIDVDSGAC